MTQLALLLLLFLSGCGVSVTDRSKGEEEKIADSSFSVVQILPASGAVADLPSTITISFSDVPHRRMLAALTHYNINCGGQTQSASSVDAESGYSSVTITLPAIGDLVDGSSCTFAVSSNIIDLSGNRLGGVRTVTYVIDR